LAHKGNARNDLKEFTIQLADKEKAWNNLNDEWYLCRGWEYSSETLGLRFRWTGRNINHLLIQSSL
jgi:hypothetical protein